LRAARGAQGWGSVSQAQLEFKFLALLALLAWRIACAQHGMADLDPAQLLGALETYVSAMEGRCVWLSRNLEAVAQSNDLLRQAARRVRKEGAPALRVISEQLIGNPTHHEHQKLADRCVQAPRCARAKPFCKKRTKVGGQSNRLSSPR
jgi:hypothetical protein